MHGLLIMNQFVRSEKSAELRRLLTNAAQAAGVALEYRRSGEILHNLDDVRAIPCDFVLFWDKDVLLAELFERCGVPVFNSSAAIYACDNKAYTALRLQEAGVRIPRTYIAPKTYESIGYSDTDFAERIAGLLGYPLILKELYGSFGQQVYLIRDREALLARIAALGHKGFLLQELIQSSFGRDVRINVVGDRVVCSMLRRNVHGDFRSNISNGGSMYPYEATPVQRKLALAACRALGLDFAGVDVLFGEQDEPIICEVNSNPHFKSSLDCTGIDLSVEILRYIREAVARR